MCALFFGGPTQSFTPDHCQTKYTPERGPSVLRHALGLVQDKTYIDIRHFRRRLEIRYRAVRLCGWREIRACTALLNASTLQLLWSPDQRMHYTLCFVTPLQVFAPEDNQARKLTRQVGLRRRMLESSPTRKRLLVAEKCTPITTSHTVACHPERHSYYSASGSEYYLRPDGENVSALLGLCAAFAIGSEFGRQSAEIGQ